jgi:UDP-4-amino-4,6-dideoxy-N-acetyl-beta-L-altrosamine transaminase
MKKIPYGKQTISDDEIGSVGNILQGDWLTQGPTVSKFESCIAEYCGAKYAIVVSNGTAALHLSNLALLLKPKAKVLTSPISFVATSNSIIYAGGIPTFCDIDPLTFNMDPAALEETLKKNPDIAGIIPVHLGGLVANMEEIHKLAKANGQWIIEDACHALAGRWTDSQNIEHRVGDCAYSDLTIFSFHPVKHITTGEGGAITTNNKSLYKHLLELRSHGITRDPSRIDDDHGDWYYEMQNLGYNYRLTDFQAALGISQLAKSDIWATRRRQLVERYDLAFEHLPKLNPQSHPANQKACYHLYIVQASNRRKLYDFLSEHKIHTQVHYIPIHLQPYYQAHYGFGVGDFPKAERYYESALSLPLFPGLTDADQEYVISKILEFYTHE